MRKASSRNDHRIRGRADHEGLGVVGLDDRRVRQTDAGAAAVAQVAGDDGQVDLVEDSFVLQLRRLQDATVWD